jgi:hypothetical protein
MYEPPESAFCGFSGKICFKEINLLGNNMISVTGKACLQQNILHICTLQMSTARSISFISLVRCSIPFTYIENIQKGQFLSQISTIKKHKIQSLTQSHTYSKQNMGLDVLLRCPLEYSHLSDLILDTIYIYIYICLYDDQLLAPTLHHLPLTSPLVAMPHIRQLGTAPCYTARVHAGSVHVQFVDKVALKQVLLQVLHLSIISIIPHWVSIVMYHLQGEELAHWWPPH